MEYCSRLRDENNTSPSSLPPIVYGECPVNSIISTSEFTSGISSQSSKTQSGRYCLTSRSHKVLMQTGLSQLVTILRMSKAAWLNLTGKTMSSKIKFLSELNITFSERGHFELKSGKHLDADFLGFYPPEDMDLWTSCIIAEAAIAKANRLQDEMNKQMSM
ncbi:MAG: hypothetical protein EZS28_043960 [Streblomastix strix]|uniref:Uncharacterized protein n=1 Tax=Streblomastix strix TaxID=222440 RepID=A0A5J4TRG9_9EUKA|nr:MAG: hypothetical protein EZS28_043960 [Streblomastix strix]